MQTKSKDHEVSELVQTITEFYGFGQQTGSDVDGSYRIIYNYTDNSELYWTSHLNQEDFLDMLRDHFEEIGINRSSSSV